MGIGLNNPLPSSMRSECRKAGKILTSFIDPKQAFGAEKVIPPHVLANAKGLAVLSVFKAGFLGTARFGSGIVIARTDSGEWSAPSAIGVVGAGFGGQLGLELTDFVFILNTTQAVKTFAQAGSLTFGANASLAAGPVGRNAEAAGAASLKAAAAVFSYSKTKGLFAGVSLEGSGFIERKDANEKLYGRKVSAYSLLRGEVKPPIEADPLIRVLQSRVFTAAGANEATASSPNDANAAYNDIPVYADTVDNRYNSTGNNNSPVPPAPAESTRPEKTPAWSTSQNYRPDETSASPSATGTPGYDTGMGDSSAAIAAAAAAAKKKPPPRPTSKKPDIGGSSVAQPALGPNEARAKFQFDPVQDGDLGFKKGDIITITQRTDSENDWWTGTIGSRSGSFPSNYVEFS